MRSASLCWLLIEDELCKMTYGTHVVWGLSLPLSARSEARSDRDACLAIVNMT